MPVLRAKANFCHGTRCLICMKRTACLEVTDVNRKGKYSMEISGVFYLSCWKQPRSVTAKHKQRVAYDFFKFQCQKAFFSLELHLWWKGRRNTLWGLLAFFCCWLLPSTFRHVCTYGLVFSLWSHAAVCVSDSCNAEDLKKSTCRDSAGLEVSQGGHFIHRQ